jgi:hypothetical protein
VGDFATDPQPKPPRARECGASIRRKDRDRASFLSVGSTSPRRSSPPVRRPMHHLKFLAVAKVEAVRPVHLAELLHLPEASAISLPTEKSSCGAADNRLAGGRDLQDHELVAAAGAHGSQPMRSAELRSCAPVEAMCLSTVTVSLSTGGASARGATVPVSALRSESRPTPRRGPPRRGRRSRRQKARRDQRSSRTKISWHPAHSISSGDDGRGSRRTGV